MAKASIGAQYALYRETPAEASCRGVVMLVQQNLLITNTSMFIPNRSRMKGVQRCPVEEY